MSLLLCLFIEWCMNLQEQIREENDETFFVVYNVHIVMICLFWKGKC